MATKLNISIDQGTSFSEVFDVADANGAPVDMTVYTGAAQIRKHYSSTNATPFSVNLASNGSVTISLSANVSANMVPGRYLYDVEVTSGSGTFRIVEGIVTITPNITR
jgi:hypothetical protein